jgi:hypothetical protein
MTAATGARLGRAFLLYLVAMVAIVTLIPFDFTLPARFRILWQGELPDAVANVVLFVPLGFLFRLTWPAPHDRRVLQSLLFGTALSLALETAQLFLPTRFSSPMDVLTNGLGAWLGALALDAVRRRLQLTPALAGRLALELPLMGLVYLLVPLLWINALAGFARRGPPLSTLLIGLLGAIALGQVYRHRFGPAGTITPLRYAGVGGAWFVAGAFVLFIAKPLVIMAGTAAVMLLVLAWSALLVSAGERRYESDTLILLAPLFTLYLVALSGWPGWLLPPVANAGTSATATAILATLELLAAFTVLGYALAEFRGRLELPFARIAPPLALGGGLVGLLLAMGAFDQPDPGLVAVRTVVAALATVYGGAIYHLQRAHIRQLLAVTSRGRNGQG